ncbi:hypothetical protein Asppvi_003386 [Aspergillus pseudoviridinutans]|uniref:Yeast cell wall synthesis Kre9/Knh1-like N-terminal domain-containing protein n=1 Tax=Aspergillus pseudoviridinutans TaxID=1517512 RepID=A0A9P3BAR3_9EURO|nr:uncharacterized protein Asppvi_003386 [Aspergillus pseudoviridinutans]GIJ84539.1 hypothetical protein Asppvi_003386 [Aspergillus pseudoviridinutans]
MRFFTVAISALVAMASAYTQPDYSKPPQGNAILKPGLNEQVPVGNPYTITWDPTTQGPVSLVLLRGPSTNVVPLSTIAEAIPNTGSYSWTPSTELENDVTHYGLLLVVEGTGQYQWSTQFGISNPDKAVESSSASVAPTTPAASRIETPTPAPASSDVTVIATETTTWCPESESTVKPTTIPVVVPTGGPSIPSGSPTPSAHASSTLVSKPHGSSTPSATTPAPSLFTGAADRTAISFGAVAAGVLAVLAF